MAFKLAQRFAIGSLDRKPVTEELRSVAALARDRSRRSIDRLTELMEHEDGKVAVAACVAILRVGGALGQGERDAANEAAVEARVLDIVARGIAKAPKLLEPGET